MEAYLGHAEMGGGALGGKVAHGIQLLRGSGHGRLEGGDLSKPALFSGLVQPVGQIGVDLLQPRQLGRVNSE